ncbi:hypothetical protein [Enterobacter asburiae]
MREILINESAWEDMTCLFAPSLSETQRWLDWLWHNFDEAKKLEVPDGTRKIFDTDEKRDELLKLSLQVDTILTAVHNEMNPIYHKDSIDEGMREYLSNSKVE